MHKKKGIDPDKIVPTLDETDVFKEEAAAVAMQAIKDGKLNEVEPVGDAIMNTDAINDAFPWVHALPDKQK